MSITAVNFDNREEGTQIRPLEYEYHCSDKKNPESETDSGFYLKEFGGVLLSHTAAHAVPSALKSLTSVFGMGTGVTSSLLPPKNDFS